MTVMCLRGEHDFSSEYSERGYECRNGCGTAKVSRAAVLLQPAPGRREPIGVRWVCYRPHRGKRRFARGEVHPLPERGRVFELLQRHERDVHGLVSVRRLPGQRSLEEAMPARGRRRAGSR